MVRQFLEGNIDETKHIHYKYWNLFKDLFVETNPIPIKTAMDMMGMLDFDMRLPMCRMQKANVEILRQTLKDCELL